MKAQSEYPFVTDCQVFNYSRTEIENSQETDGVEEEKEFRFFSKAVDDHNQVNDDKVE